jgi:GTP cyclohydrolase II
MFLKADVTESSPAESQTQKAVTIRRSVRIPLAYGEGVFHTFHGLKDRQEHVAISFGDLNGANPPLVRVHSECLTGDVFSSGRCDCGEQLQETLRRLEREGGILLYLRQEGRGIGLYNKLDAYELQQKGYDTYEANRLLGLGDDLRDYEVAAQMLRALGQPEIRLVTNNPEKRRQLEELGIQVAETIPTGVFLKPTNEAYLVAKVLKTGHSIRL